MDELLAAVRQEAGEAYTVFGELGRESDTDVWYLARERDSKKLVAMRLFAEKIGTDGQKDFVLEVAKELNASVSVGLSDCPGCGTPMRRWGRFCTRCGASLADEASASPAEREILLARVREEANAMYDVLGEMPWSGGGTVFFAIERASGRLVRLRLKADAEGEGLGETQAMFSLKPQISAGYMTQVMAAPKALTTPPPRVPPAAPVFSGPRAKPKELESPARPVTPSPVPAKPAPVPVRSPDKGWEAPLSSREWAMVGVIVLLSFAVVVLLAR